MSALEETETPGPQKTPPEPAPRSAARRQAGTRLWQRALLGLVRRIVPRVRRMDRPAAMRLGVRLGGIARAVAGRRRDAVALRNLRLAFPEMPPAERARLLGRVYEHFGKMLVDFLRGNADRGLIAGCEGWDEHVAPLLAEGRPFVVCSAHLGNWELLGRWVAAQPGVKAFTVVAREPEDPAFAAWVREMREGAGLQVANKGDQARRLLSALKRGEGLGVLIDQNSGDLFVPFFGVPAGTVAGPPLFARRTGAALIPSYCVRDPDDRYRLLFLPPLSAPDPGAKGGEAAEADNGRVMAEANRALEGVVRRYPEQWLWLHHRWKSAFEEPNRPRWPAGHSFEAARSAWSADPQA